MNLVLPPACISMPMVASLTAVVDRRLAQRPSCALLLALRLGALQNANPQFPAAPGFDTLNVPGRVLLLASHSDRRCCWYKNSTRLPQGLAYAVCQQLPRSETFVLFRQLRTANCAW